ncbi:hypothetical protein D048_1905B, partial [Vibrio parahaemolyticus VPTS-2009]
QTEIDQQLTEIAKSITTERQIKFHLIN